MIYFQRVEGEKYVEIYMKPRASCGQQAAHVPAQRRPRRLRSRPCSVQPPAVSAVPAAQACGPGATGRTVQARGARGEATSV